MRPAKNGSAPIRKNCYSLWFRLTQVLRFGASRKNPPSSNLEAIVKRQAFRCSSRLTGGCGDKAARLVPAKAPTPSEDECLAPLIAGEPADSPLAHLEVVRFAACNQLCVHLDYQGSAQWIEPCSLCRARDGNIILRTKRVSDGERRSYRINHIQVARAARWSFVPRFNMGMNPQTQGRSFSAPR